MLRADRTHLEAKISQLAIEVRGREARLFDANFQLLSQLSAFVMGIGFMILNMKIQYIHRVAPTFGFRDFDSTPEVLYTAFVSISIGFNVLVMAISSWCIVYGQDLAIRGVDSAMMKRSVDGLYEERKHTIRLFLCGLAALLIAGFMVGWCTMHLRARICVMTVFTCNIIGIAYYLLTITRPKFRVPK